MPVHDSSRVEAGIFHDFHNAWLTELRNACKEGLLPDGFYALTEQHAGHFIIDLLTLQTPRVRHRLSSSGAFARRRRTLAIRHVSHHRLVALVEIVSAANKDRAEHVEEFRHQLLSALHHGIHVLLIDLFPPGGHDRQGMHGTVWQELDDEPYQVPAGEPLTLASYAAVGERVDAFVEPLSFGAALPPMPLFLQPDRYVNVPLEATYQAAFRGVPAFYRRQLEEGGPAPA